MQQEARRYLPIDDSQINMIYLGTSAPASLTCSDEHNILKDSPLNTAKLKVAIFGRVEHGKGQHLLVDSLIELDKKGCDISVTLVGHVMDTTYRDDLQKKIKSHKLTDKCQFFGFVDNPVEKMKCFDVIVLSTYCETFGLTLIEAMRAGIAVIGTDCGGVPEIIKHKQTGLLFNPGSVSGLSQALIEYYNNPEYRQDLAKAGKEWADKQFDSEKHMRKMVAILKR